MATHDLHALMDERERDLGFGAVVSRESEQRLLNRDGTFNVQREGIGFWESLNIYQALLTMSWPRLFGLIIAFYVIGNALFAFAYVACGPSALQGTTGISSRFARAFFFSVETSSTIGYSNLLASGVAAHILMMVEVLVGLLSFAVVTGVVFARFSRPAARLVFSRRAVIAPFQGGRAFMFRVVNSRNTQIIDLRAKIVFTRFEEKNGVRMRQYYSLSLERPSVVFIPLSWTVVHPIEESSPLYGMTPQEMESARGEFLVLL
ncbi:MAG TPA: ion channel, partial [Terriglobales bacterium]|nr:ion channel [Terriglobales bacterium]